VLNVEINPEDARTVTTDDRGRAHLGPDLKNSEVRLVILDARSVED